jgi:hypothetical protein
MEKFNMKMQVTLLAIVATAGLTALTPALSRDAADTAYDAQKEADKAAVKDTKAARDTIRSQNAVDEGRPDTAARHAKKAAKEDRSAGRKLEKTTDLEGKAGEKAVKEELK